MKISCTIIAFVAFFLISVPAVAATHGIPQTDGLPAIGAHMTLSGEGAALDRAPLHKFTDAMRRHEALLAASSADRAAWASVVRNVSAGDRRAVLEAVNISVNRMRYEADGGTDSWSAPVEFLQRGSGDCEDYALAKYAALRALGVPAAEMAIMVFVAPRIGAHAVLVVSDGQDMRILDNRHSQLVSASRADLGRVTYLVNENRTKLFLRSRLATAASGAR